MFWGEYKDLRCPKLRKHCGFFVAVEIEVILGLLMQTFHILTICDTKDTKFICV